MGSLLITGTVGRTSGLLFAIGDVVVPKERTYYTLLLWGGDSITSEVLVALRQRILFLQFAELHTLLLE